MDDDARYRTIVCVRCGRAWPLDAADGLCPVCLLNTGVADSELPTRSTGSPMSPADEMSNWLHEGDTWGNYRIGRLLGRGGMGEVFEAEQLSTGRRLALKVLRRRLQRPEDRARFLREGQLAASVSHPHTVYIFGSEEIAGIPVITMELLTGRTLKDRVAAEGPLAPSAAAAAVLDIIGGLDAAHAAGILHRDIKPSNCFLNHDGSVKVGDFGLSISTLSRDVNLELATGGFQGTPQFAAPEQLRGEPLDVRADIYAVGATLYYLLTGQPPFGGAAFAELIARTLHEPPPSPRAARRDVPPGLASLVVQCLSRSPAVRPQSYAALAEALRPYVRANNAPPRPGARVLAGVVDSVTAGLPMGAIVVWLQSHAGVIGLSALPPLERRVAASLWLIIAAYYLTFEYLWGAGLGKRLFGLRVVSAIGPPSLRQLLIRTAIFCLPGMVQMAVVLWRGSLPAIVFGAVNLPETVTSPATGLLFGAILFASARSGNGWSGLHDLISGTRVVAPLGLGHRTSRAAEVAAPVPALDSRVRYGPFVAVADLGATDRGTLLLAFDPVLRRDVWIHRVPPGDPPTSRARQDVSRIGRLHWLGGQRTADHQWDAFEAPSGRALLTANEPVGWATVKVWLMDLADEFITGERDGSPSSASLQHLWLRDDGRVVVLDFRYPATGVVHDLEASIERAATQLLAAVAGHVRSQARTASHGPGSYPLSVLTLIDMWRRGLPRTPKEVRNQLLGRSGFPDRVTRARRALPLALSLAPVFVMTLAGLMAIPAMRQMRTAEHANMLQWLDLLIAPGPDSRLLDPALREDAERYVVERFRSSLGDNAFWRTVNPQPVRQSQRHDLARRLLDGYRPTPGKSFAEVSVRLAPEIDRANAVSTQIADEAPLFASVVFALMSAIVVGLVMVCHFVSSLLVPGGVITRLNGLAVVTADDREVRRGRSLVRVLLVWSPAIAWFVYLAVVMNGPARTTAPQTPIVPLALTYLLLAGGMIATLVTPWRGWHDRLARTWVIPR